jgi:Tfp pilus assembly protein PilX
VRHSRGQDGAALIIGLVVLTSFALVIGSLMSLGGSSLIATSALRDQRARIYAAEAAVDEEATRLRAGSLCGGDAGPGAPQPFAAPSYILPKANPVSITVQSSQGPGGTCVLSAYDGSQPILQARFAIDQTAGTASVRSWDASPEHYNPPDPDRGGD